MLTLNTAPTPQHPLWIIPLLDLPQLGIINPKETELPVLLLRIRLIYIPSTLRTQLFQRENLVTLHVPLHRIFNLPRTPITPRLRGDQVGHRVVPSWIKRYVQAAVRRVRDEVTYNNTRGAYNLETLCDKFYILRECSSREETGSGPASSRSDGLESLVRACVSDLVEGGDGVLCEGIVCDISVV